VLLSPHAVGVVEGLGEGSDDGEAEGVVVGLVVGLLVGGAVGGGQIPHVMEQLCATACFPQYLSFLSSVLLGFQHSHAQGLISPGRFMSSKVKPSVSAALVQSTGAMVVGAIVGDLVGALVGAFVAGVYPLLPLCPMLVTWALRRRSLAEVAPRIDRRRRQLIFILNV